MGSHKIDNYATAGMLGVSDSLAYHAHVTRRAVNNYERWFCDAGTPVAGTHEADRIGTSTTAFVATGGNAGAWGNWLQVLGTSDTPSADAPGFKFYNVQRFLVTTCNQVAIYFVQIGFGASGAAALTAHTFMEFAYNPASNTDRTDPITIRARRQAAGTAAWVRIMTVAGDGKTMSFMLGIHEYEG